MVSEIIDEIKTRTSHLGRFSPANEGESCALGCPVRNFSTFEVPCQTVPCNRRRKTGLDCMCRSSTHRERIQSETKIESEAKEQLDEDVQQLKQEQLQLSEIP
jgi:hypothetical protein